MTRALGFLQFLTFLHLSRILLVVAQDSGQLIYNGFKDSGLILDGVAIIHPDGLLQLTNHSRHVSGHAFHQAPFNFNTSSSRFAHRLSFSTTFILALDPEFSTLGGSGIAFVISPSTDFTHALALQFLGLFNSSNDGNSSNRVFAIEFDTILNPELKDVNDNHVGVDVNSIASVFSAPAAYFSSIERKKNNLTLISGKPIQAWIDYDGFDKLINVTLAPSGIPKPSQPLLSTILDLSSVLFDSMYAGFSASTGSVVSNQYVLGWSFNKNGQAQNLDLSKLPRLPKVKKSRKGLRFGVITLLVSVSILMIIGVGIFYISRRRKYMELREEWEQEYGPQRFCYKNLYQATKGFHDKELLGVGGFGKVYRGELPGSGVQVAIKKVSHGSSQGIKEFVAEIASMGRLRHRNLVQLLGYCRRKGELLLVYDYMPNGCLEKYLHTNDKPNLTWPQRYQILKGIASSLLYLHEEWEQVVLHRDVKASNVLLDADLNGRLGDFGLARLYDHGENPQTTHVVGTVGYIAPELTRTGKATTCTDVFAFGAFMLEVACGRRPVKADGSSEEILLVDWVYKSWKEGVLLRTSDIRLEGDYVVEEMELVLMLGLFCSHPSPAARPSMRQVVQYLDGLIALDNAAGLYTEVDGAFNGFTTSSEITASLGQTTSVCSLSSSESILTRPR